jgi:hypothetical protein
MLIITSIAATCSLDLWFFKSRFCCLPCWTCTDSLVHRLVTFIQNDEQSLPPHDMDTHLTSSSPSENVVIILPPVLFQNGNSIFIYMVDAITPTVLHSTVARATNPNCKATARQQWVHHFCFVLVVTLLPYYYAVDQLVVKIKFTYLLYHCHHQFSNNILYCCQVCTNPEPTNIRIACFLWACTLGPSSSLVISTSD